MVIRPLALAIAASLIAVGGCRESSDAPADTVGPFSLTREAAFGSASAEDQLVQPVVLLVDRNGTTYVGDVKHTKFFVYDSEGKLLRSFGRYGKGPGEFQMLGMAGWKDDTLWVLDPGLSRVNFITEGAVVRTESVPRKPNGPPLAPDAHLADGSYIVRLSPPPKAGGPQVRGLGGGAANLGDINNGITYALTRVSGDATRFDTLTTFTCAPAYVHIEMKGSELASISVSVPPIVDCPISRVDDRGVYLYHLGDLLAAQPDSASYVITRWSRGTKQWEKRFPFTPVAMQDSMLDRLTAPFATVDGKLNLRQQKALNERIATLKYFPTVSDALVGTDGALLLRREIGGAQYTWTVLDSAGTIRGAFTLPLESKILEATGTHIWVSEVDENEDLRVVRYRLTR